MARTPWAGFIKCLESVSLREREATGSIQKLPAWGSCNSWAKCSGTILFLQGSWTLASPKQLGVTGAQQQYQCAPCNTCCPTCSQGSWGSKWHPAHFKTAWEMVAMSVRFWWATQSVFPCSCWAIRIAMSFQGHGLCDPHVLLLPEQSSIREM